ncbi:MAG: hypothetical protein QF464_07925 [Myxococcota bacterium]|jgi:hypothetical protein|nr:hypothetical protein [Myxococcota bacterium]
MHAARIITLIVALVVVAPASAETLEGHTLTATSKVTMAVTATGRYSSVDVRLHNTTRASHTVRFSWGAHFDPAVSVQPLAITTRAERTVAAGATVTLTLQTVCMDPSKSVAGTGFAAWRGDHDPGLAGVFAAIEFGRHLPLFSHWFSDPTKAHHTTQGIVWVYFDASKERMVSFAATHMFNGQRARATAFVDSVYPFAKNLLAFYKRSIGR